MRLALLFAALVALPPAAAQAFDLTGTWTGKLTCKGTDGQNFKDKLQVLVEITQIGDDVALQFPFDGGADVYNGFAIETTGKPNQGGLYFVHCGVSHIPGTGEGGFDESGFAKVNTKPNGKGSLKATTAYFFTDPPVGAATCKWRLKRNDLADPGVLGCIAKTSLQRSRRAMPTR